MRYACRDTIGGEVMATILALGVMSGPIVSDLRGDRAISFWHACFAILPAMAAVVLGAYRIENPRIFAVFTNEGVQLPMYSKYVAPWHDVATFAINGVCIELTLRHRDLAPKAWPRRGWLNAHARGVGIDGRVLHVISDPLQPEEIEALRLAADRLMREQSAPV